MNIIWLMLIIAHGGLILVLESMFPIPYRVCKINSKYEIEKENLKQQLSQIPSIVSLTSD